MTRSPRTARCALVLTVALAIAAAPRAASAQSAQDKAAADVLFQQGKKLMQEGKVADACPKFAESLRLDTGTGTMLWLADCYERSGKTASAWGQFLEAAETAGKTKDAREKVARERAKQLEPKLVRLLIVVPDASAVGGIEVSRDGTMLGKPLWGTPVPVDPGSHVVAASAPGFKRWEDTVDTSAVGKTVTVTIPALAPLDAAAVATTKPEASSPKPADPGKTQRTIALAAGGVGVVGAIVGTIFGFTAKSDLDKSNADGHCLPNSHCDATGVQARSDAKSAATLSTVGFIVGVLGLGAGAALWFTAPKPASKAGFTLAPRLELPHGGAAGGVEILGRF